MHKHLLWAENKYFKSFVFAQNGKISNLFKQIIKIKEFAFLFSTLQNHQL